MNTEITLGDRMKKYEEASRTVLTHGVPKIIRLDGKAFHTFTKSFKQPYDADIMESMCVAAQAVMKEIGGIARFAYIQSDECSICINDAITDMSQPWYANQVQKMVSVSAAIMSVSFSYAITKKINAPDVFKTALFDSRIFQVPSIDEVLNNMIWRQQDATRNSISQWSRSMFSHKELQGKNSSEMQDMMMSKGFNWNDAATWTKRGVVVYKVPGEQEGERTTWVSDYEIPVFTKDREYLKELFGEKKESSSVEQIPERFMKVQ
jgi:tRNA(His) 5'-end guanylyltransferase